MDKYTILVIDDDPYTLEVFECIGEMLEDCRLLTAANCTRAHKLLEEHPADIILLDIVLPDKNGYDLCKELKEHPHAADAYYIFMSVEKHNLIDRLRAYNLAAQDFVVKPFDIEEMRVILQSKLNYLKRFKAEKGPQADEFDRALHLGRFTLDNALHAIHIDRKTVDLTAMEHKLMKFFFNHPDTVWNARQLLEKVWEQRVNSFRTIDTSSVRTLIRKLRQKLENDPTQPDYLITAANGGYMFCPAGARAAITGK